MQYSTTLAARSVSSSHRPPRVIVANDQEVWIWSLETILGPHGYTVTRATSAEQLLSQVESVQPDVVILHATLRDVDGVELCRQLRDGGMVSAATPILLTATGPWRRTEKLEVLQAGGWHCLSLPIDAEELLARLSVFLAAKANSDEARATGLIDPATGFYDVQGILLRVRELGLAARRHARALGVVTVASGDAPGSAALSTRVPGILRNVVRGSDVIGRLGRNEFVILAPETEMPGLLRLADRLVGAFDAEECPACAEQPLRVGCYAVADFAATQIEPVEMIVRATHALRLAQLPGAAPIQSFAGE